MVGRKGFCHKAQRSLTPMGPSVGYVGGGGGGGGVGRGQWSWPHRPRGRGTYGYGPPTNPRHHGTAPLGPTAVYDEHTALDCLFRIRGRTPFAWVRYISCRIGAPWVFPPFIRIQSGSIPKDKSSTKKKEIRDRYFQKKTGVVFRPCRLGRGTHGRGDRRSPRTCAAAPL